MASRFTNEQQAAIESQGKTIVSASAGSGKTTVMIEKIIQLIKGGTSVDTLLAVTFTKKAATQMKEKLCKELIESINAPDTTSEKRSALKKQLSEVPSADISTIHSFCAKLLRRHFFAAGVDNTFRVIGGDDAEGLALKNAALDELFEEGYEEKDEEFSHLLSVYWRKKSDNALRKIFLSVYEELRNRADYRRYLERSGRQDEHDFANMCGELHALLLTKCAYYKEFVEDEVRYFEKIEAAPQLALATELSKALSDILSMPDYYTACALQKPKFTAKRSSKTDSEEKKEHIERLAFLKGKLVKIYDDELCKTLSFEEELQSFLCSQETARALGVYLLRFDAKYEQLKADRGVLDYNDLEHKTLALLKNEEIVKAIQEKYRFVFVDEYQDVNPVQEEIISLLSGENLFLVGDVKQSIYGFRGSKSKFFIEKQKQFENGEGKNLALTRNFRSSDAILDAVNAQFSCAMSSRTSKIDYAKDSYMERGGRYALNDGKVQIHVVGKEPKKASEGRGIYSVKASAKQGADEESLIAKNIRSIIETEKLSTYYDPDEGEYRPVKYSDIAILSRKKQGQIAKTVATLSAEGIPVSAAVAVNVCDYAEVKTLIDILSLIDNAQQDVPLCSALLSPLGGLTADDLAEIRLAYNENKKTFRYACEKYVEERSDKTAYKLKKFYEYFRRIRDLSRVLDAGELLTQIITETRMEARLLSQDNGVACLKRIHRFIEETYSPEPLSVHAFLAKLKDMDYKIEFSESGGEDSVKVLTMHSSKGLEYPVVILDDLNALFRGVDHEEVLVEETYGLAPYAFDLQKMTKRQTLLRRLHQEKALESAIADELNLYYVALTRAKYSLHMLIREKTVMADVRYARSFAEFTDFSVWEKYIVTDEPFDVPKQERQALAFHPDEELVRGIMNSFLWEYPYAVYENLPVKSSATQLLEESKITTVHTGEKNETRFVSLFDSEEEYEGTGVDAKAVGIAYHAFLERFDFSALYKANGEPIARETLQDVVKDAYEKLQEEGISGTELLSVDKLTEILSNPVFYQLQDGQLYKEQQFLVSLPIKETYAKKSGMTALQERSDDEEILFQGAIDLLFVGETVRIIDYKFSKGSAGYLREHYKPQLELYRLATAKIMGIDPSKIRCSIVNIDRGFQVDMDETL